MTHQHAPACDRNREPILSVLRVAFATARRVLEIGSGTGQHAVFFAKELPHLYWQASEVPGGDASIRAWVADAGLPNVGMPLSLDVTRQEWGCGAVDGVFTANSLHIMSWSSVLALFRGVGRVLEPGGTVVIYGPFNYEGRYTSDSNEQFDVFLKARDPRSGIRDFEAVAAAAHELAGLAFERDAPMPANNRTLVFRKPVVL
jgi:SAM-dependent methyltransferase